MKIVAKFMLIAFIISLFAGCGKEAPKPNMADVNGNDIRDRANKAWKEIK
jgi:uncharacterized lipoprotein YehR (DUF1307 family)